VPCGDVVTAEFVRLAQQRVELDVAIALHARVGRAPAAVLVDEVADDRVGEGASEVQHIVRDAKPPCDTTRILHRAQRAATAMSRVRMRLLPNLHRDADDLEAAP
jgi:hypothetical protein